MNDMIAKLEPELIQVRHFLHEMPETAYEEVKTGAYIDEYLCGLKTFTVSRLAKTGVKAVFNKPGTTKNRRVSRGYGRFARDRTHGA